jgi:hypothetical protein
VFIVISLWRADIFYQMLGFSSRRIWERIGIAVL